MTDSFTDTDKKLIFTDHDLLVRLNTKMDMMIDEQKDFRRTYEDKHTDLVKRTSILEVEQARQNEALDNLCVSVGDLQKKSDRWDIVNSIATAAVAIIAYFTGR